MMRKVLLICVAGLLTAGPAGAGPYNPTAPPAGPFGIVDRGLVVHCDTNGQPSTYGELRDNSDNWSYAVPGIGQATNENWRNIYYTTDGVGVQTAMNANKEWIVKLEMRWEYTAAAGDDTFYTIELGATGGDILRIAPKPGDNNWWVEGAWNFWLEAAPPQDEFFTLIFHYMPDHPHPERNNGALDIWVNDQLGYGALEAKNGANDYNLNVVALKGYASYDDILVGEIIPEPVTMLLLGLGGLTVLRKRR